MKLAARALCFVALALSSARVYADTDAGQDGGPVEAESTSPPLACDGGLCDTTIGSECGIARGVGRASSYGAAMAVAAAIAATIAARRARRMNRAWPVAVTLAAATTPARAEDRGVVDVRLHEPAPPHRLLAVAWNPLPLFTIGKASADVVITPGDHHAAVVSPFYASTRTAPVVAFDDAGTPRQLPEQRFHGLGLELGYRYYFERGGPRGIFVGPSLLLGSFTAHAQNGIDTSYLQYGLAADAGYQILLADRVPIALGGGLQYASTSKTIPDQQFPSWIYANRRLSPRVLFSVGWGF